jgi:hypothetical protein
MADDDSERPRAEPAHAVLSVMRRSVELVQDLLHSAALQAEQVRSLEDELASARQRLSFLEGETTQLRRRLAEGVQDVDPSQLEELIDDQNAFAHLFVTSDRLARVRTPDEVVRVADEVILNLVGADRYSMWLSWEGEPPRMVAPFEAKWRAAPDQYPGLVGQAIATGVAARPATSRHDVPVALPLLLDGAGVGAILITRLVPQVGTLARLQEDLLQLLSDRIAPSLCLTALRGGSGGVAVPWAGVRGSVPSISTSISSPGSGPPSGTPSGSPPPGVRP